MQFTKGTNKKEIDISNDYTQNDCSDSDMASLLNEKIISKLSKHHHLSTHPLSSFELSNLKNIASAFFIIFLITTSLVAMKYIPNLYKTANGIESIAAIKYSFSNFSAFFSEQPSSIKSIILISQIIFLFLCGCLFGLLNQRMSVPEYQNKKYLNFTFIISSSISSLCLIINSFYYKESIVIFRYYGIVDNGFFILFMIFIILTCLFSYLSLQTVFNMNKDDFASFIFKFKEATIAVMGLSFIGYFISMFVVSVYTASTSGEEIFVSIIMICMGVNCMVFLTSFCLFVLTFRFDIDYVYSILNTQPDIEYFIDNTSTNSVEEDDE